MASKITELQPLATGEAPVSLSLRLNSELILHLHQCLARGEKPRLVVNGENLSLKISKDLVFPCNVTPDKSKVDLYSRQDGRYAFNGRVSGHLSVIMDPKIAREVRGVAPSNTTLTTVVPCPKPEAVTTSVPNSPFTANSFRVYDGDSKGDMISKFLSLLALGPITRDSIVHKTSLSNKYVDSFITSYANVYDPNDVFIADDIFPIQHAPQASEKPYILMDKAYKELRPCQVSGYSERERSMVLNNTHNALTRLGYLKTHPLRKKICGISLDVENDAKKKSSNLGGGLLVSKKSSYRRAYTESPNLKAEPSVPNSSSKQLEKQLEKAKSVESPLKTSSKRNKSPAGIQLDHDKIRKRRKQETEYTSPPSSINDESGGDSASEGTPGLSHNPNQKRSQYYYSLAEKFKAKYKDYEKLYISLKSNSTSASNDKRQLTKLFELHNQLSEWKRKLWHFDNESKLKQDIMDLPKYKKKNSKPNAESALPDVEAVYRVVPSPVKSTQSTKVQPNTRVHLDY